MIVKTITYRILKLALILLSVFRSNVSAAQTEDSTRIENGYYSASAHTWTEGFRINIEGARGYVYSKSILNSRPYYSMEGGTEIKISQNGRIRNISIEFCTLDALKALSMMEMSQDSFRNFWIYPIMGGDWGLEWENLRIFIQNRWHVFAGSGIGNSIGIGGAAQIKSFSLKASTDYKTDIVSHNGNISYGAGIEYFHNL